MAGSGVLGVAAALFTYVLLLNVFCYTDTGQIYNDYYSNNRLNAKLPLATNLVIRLTKKHLGFGRHVLTTTFIQLHLPNRTTKRSKSKINPQQSYAFLIIISLLLSGDIHQCPGPLNNQQHDRPHITPVIGASINSSNQTAVFGGDVAAGWMDVRAGHGASACVDPHALPMPGASTAATCSQEGGVLSAWEASNYRKRSFSSRIAGESSPTLTPKELNANQINSDLLGSQTCKHRKWSTNPAVVKNRKWNVFQTVNHSKIIWDSKLKPNGLFGGHINIRSLVSKFEQIQFILTKSNLDFLCLSETWLKANSPSAAITVPGYQILRRDRAKSKGGGVMIYIKNSILYEEINLADCDLECIGLKIILSPQMSFSLIVLYRPPNSNIDFYEKLQSMLSNCNFDKEVMIMGDFNVNWEDRVVRKNLKQITDRFDLTQVIKGPTRVTPSTKTQIDLIFSNRPERIKKSFNMITGISDHNLVLVTRKLSKKRFGVSKVKDQESFII
nr:uncharacterized protein LOC129415608 [Misgurnus anguillicaudatus]